MNGVEQGCKVRFTQNSRRRHSNTCYSPIMCGGGGPGGGKGVMIKPCGGIMGLGGRMGMGGIGGMGMMVAAATVEAGGGGGFGVVAGAVVAGGGGWAEEEVVAGMVMSFIGGRVVGVGIGGTDESCWGLEGPMRSFSSSGLNWSEEKKELMIINVC